MAAIPIFYGDKFDFWCVKMRTLFSSMDLWDVVEHGYDGQTLTEIELKQQHQRDAVALSKIQQGVSDCIFPKIIAATTAKQAWDILQQEFLGVEGISTPSELESVAAPGKAADTNVIVATLVAAVTFAAGFTVPGGYGNDEFTCGEPVLFRNLAFQVFMLSDTLAMTLAVSTMLIYSIAAMMRDQEVPLKHHALGHDLNMFAMISMVVAFASGTYATLPQPEGFLHPSGLARGICVLCCIPIALYIYIRYVKPMFIGCNCRLFHRADS